MLGSRTPYHFDYKPTKGVEKTKEQGYHLSPDYQGDHLYPGSRWGHSMTVDVSGTVWMFGGYSMGFQQDVWNYDIEEGIWTFRNPQVESNDQGPNANLPYPGCRYFHRLVTLSDGIRLRLFGGKGYSSGGKGFLQDVWDYDTLRETWLFRNITKEMESELKWKNKEDSFSDPITPSGRNEASVNDSIFVFGGWEIGEYASSVGGYASVDHMWIFSDSTSSWSYKKSSSSELPSTGYGRADWKVEVDGDTWLIVFGGFDDYSNSLHRYSVTSNDWKLLSSHSSSSSSLALPRAYACSLRLESEYIGSKEDYLFFIGGEIGTDELLSDMWQVLVNKEAGGSFSLVKLTTEGSEMKPNAPGIWNGDNAYFQSRMWHSCVSVGRKIMLFGGLNDSYYSLSDVWIMTVPCAAEGACGDSCDQFICSDGFWSNDTNHVCSGHGKCASPQGPCQCDDLWEGPSCSHPPVHLFCHDTLAKSPLVCSSHGICNTSMNENTCRCDAGYSGERCENPTLLDRIHDFCSPLFIVGAVVCGLLVRFLFGCFSPPCVVPKNDEAIMQENIDLRRQIKILTSDKASLETDKDGLVKDNARLKNDQTGLENDKARLESDNAVLENENAALVDDNARLKNDKASLENDKAALVNELRTKKEERTRMEADFESEKTRLQRQSRFLQTSNEELTHRVIALTDRLGIEAVEEQHQKPFVVRIISPSDATFVRGDTVAFRITAVNDGAPIESVRFGTLSLHSCEEEEEQGEDEEGLNGSSLQVEVECQTGGLRPQTYPLAVNDIEIEHYDVVSGDSMTYYAVVHESLSLEALSCLVRCEVRQGMLGRISSLVGLSDDAEREIEPLRAAIEEFAGVTLNDCELVRNRWIEVPLRPKKARKVQQKGRFFLVQGIDESEHVVTLERDPPKHFVLQTDVVETLGQEGWIGKGANGVVRHGILDIGPTSFEVAIKKQWIDCDGAYPDSLLDAEREVKIMCECKHPNVLRCRGCYVARNGERAVTLCILSDYCPDGTILKWLRKKRSNGTLHNADKISCLEQAAVGMLYLHRKGLIHRDLKPDNLLMKNGQVKICDLGFTRHQDSMISSIVRGTPDFISREAMEVTATPIPNDEMFLVDVYAFGICMWSIWTLTKPYAQLKEAIVRSGGDVNLGLLNRIHPSIGSGRESIRPDVDECDGMPEEVVELMIRCWDDDVRVRPDFAEIVKILSESY